MGLLNAALDEFLGDLKRTEELLALVEQFRKVATSSVPEEVASGEIAWPESLELKNMAHSVRTDLPIFSGSMLMYVCGRFEYFIREIVVLIADDMASKASTYKDLPEEVRKHLRVKTLEIAQNPARYNYDDNDSVQFLTTLGKCLEGTESGAVQIHARLLTITESNMNARALADVLKRVSITDLWKECGKQLKLKNYLGKAADGECSNEAQARLSAIMKQRNDIAHPAAGGVAFPGEGQVLEASGFFRELAEVIVALAHLSR